MSFFLRMVIILTNYMVVEIRNRCKKDFLRKKDKEKKTRNNKKTTF